MEIDFAKPDDLTLAYPFQVAVRSRRWLISLLTPTLNVRETGERTRCNLAVEFPTSSPLSGRFLAVHVRSTTGPSLKFQCVGAAGHILVCVDLRRGFMWIRPRATLRDDLTAFTIHEEDPVWKQYYVPRGQVLAKFAALMDEAIRKPARVSSFTFKKLNEPTDPHTAIERSQIAHFQAWYGGTITTINNHRHDATMGRHNLRVQFKTTRRRDQFKLHLNQYIGSDFDLLIFTSPVGALIIPMVELLSHNCVNHTTRNYDRAALLFTFHKTRWRCGENPWTKRREHTWIDKWAFTFGHEDRARLITLLWAYPHEVNPFNIPCTDIPSPGGQILSEIIGEHAYRLSRQTPLCPTAQLAPPVILL